MTVLAKIHNHRTTELKDVCIRKHKSRNPIQIQTNFWQRQVFRHFLIVFLTKYSQKITVKVGISPENNFQSALKQKKVTPTFFSLYKTLFSRSFYQLKYKQQFSGCFACTFSTLFEFTNQGEWKEYGMLLPPDKTGV